MSLIFSHLYKTENMKKIVWVLFLFSCVAIISKATIIEKNMQSIDTPKGAWQLLQGDLEYALIAADGYCMVAQFDKNNKKFIGSYGGPFKIENNKWIVDVQFHTLDKTLVGKPAIFDWKPQKNKVVTNISGTPAEWTQTDIGGKNLEGNWRITQRKQEDGKMSEIPLRARRTLKLLSSSRFQWAAINIETGEFFGTGGGTYTFKDGKYTEQIEFFSRDNSRVGASLTFDAKIEEGNWIHSGLSSKGDPIYEVWGRMK